MGKIVLLTYASNRQSNAIAKHLKAVPNKNPKVMWSADPAFALSSTSVAKIVGDVKKLMTNSVVELIYSKNYTEDQVISLLSKKINTDIRLGKVTSHLCQIREMALSRSCSISSDDLGKGYFLHVVLRKKS